ncbi:hypothetical protein B0E34_20030 [Chryseobacterium mucoviscidosis]|uniref:Uncharacterized protein n=1 Tax=Chryseobacterium mucoviscidosis TaxID=1945581 RepID=A0A202BR59_9FLAO|nr:hypothetical protein B0E34_20030 [Chryseobacterium mucoviscidosis]
MPEFYLNRKRFYILVIYPKFGIILIKRKVKQRDSIIRNSAFKIYEGVKLIKVIPFLSFLNKRSAFV